MLSPANPYASDVSKSPLSSRYHSLELDAKRWAYFPITDSHVIEGAFASLVEFACEQSAAHTRCASESEMCPRACVGHSRDNLWYAEKQQ